MPISIAALAGVQPAEAGLASGLFNTSQQIGGALGIAALSTIATSTTTSDLSSGTAPAFALTNGFQDAFIAGAIVAFVGILVAVFVVSRSDLTRRSRRSSPPSSRPPSHLEWAAGRPARRPTQNRIVFTSQTMITSVRTTSTSSISPMTVNRSMLTCPLALPFPFPALSDASTMSRT